MAKTQGNESIPTVDEADLFALVRWVKSLPTPEAQLAAATDLGDRVRDTLLPELAAIRRLAAVVARKELMNQGVPATEATRQLAEKVGASPQTINRLLTERGQYGYQEGE